MISMSLFSDSVEIAEEDLQLLRENVKETEQIAEELLKVIDELDESGEYQAAREKVEKALENSRKTGKNTRKIRGRLDELEK